MTIAEASSSLVNVAAETIYGTAPAQATQMRYTGEGLNFSPETSQSEEINPNADVTDLIPAGGASEGDLNFEFSYGDPFEMLLEQALRNDFDQGVDLNLDGGTARKSITAEKVFIVSADADPVITSFLYTGLRVNTFSLTVNPRTLITGAINLRGRKPILAQGPQSTTQVFFGGDLLPANTNPIMTASLVGSITVAGGLTSTFRYTNLSWQLNNNLRDLPEIGSDDPIDVNYGQRVVTGNLTAYFDENGLELYNALLSGTEFSLSYAFEDAPSTPNSYTVEFPRCKFSSGSVVAQGNNQDVLAEMEFQALQGTLTSPAGQSSIRITKSS